MRTDGEIDAQIERIAAYMRRHGQHDQPRLGDVLSPAELALLEDFDLLLSALSDGSLAKAGHQKKASIHFDSPSEMFDELVAVARRYRHTQSAPSDHPVGTPPTATTDPQRP